MEELRALQLTIARRTTELVDAREGRKSTVRAPLPKFDGSPLAFRSFMSLFDKSVTYYSEEGKINALDHAMVGSRKEELMAAVRADDQGRFVAILEELRSATSDLPSVGRLSP